MTKKKEGVVPRVSNSGCQDIWITEYGRFSVRVCGDYVGNKIDLDEAVLLRDGYRKEHNLKPASY